MMAAQPTTLTLEQFRDLDLSEKPYLEFWFGETFRKPVGTFNHGLLQLIVGHMLVRLGLLAATEVRVRIGGGAELVPDLIVASQRPAGRYISEPFELAVEIRSPEQSLPWLTKKARYYVEQGVKHVWIIDPEARTAWMFTQGQMHGEWISMEDSLVVGSLELPLQAIFDEFDKALTQEA